jgi:hypothetical protein
MTTATFKFPSTHTSVTAEVLERLLNREHLTSIDAVIGAGTTRLAAYVHYLGRTYGWPIASQEKAVPCRDGRVAWVSEYYLPAAVVERAMAAGGAAWCNSVQTARAAQRFDVSDAAHRAHQANSRHEQGSLG